jgi:hypothetical protein
MPSGTRKVVRAGLQLSEVQHGLRFLRLCHLRGFYLPNGAGASWRVYAARFVILGFMRPARDRVELARGHTLTVNQGCSFFELRNDMPKGHCGR